MTFYCWWDKIDKKRIAEIRERCESATPGPWRTVVLGNTVKSLQIISHGICKKICLGISPKSKDADFIVHAREDVPYLLDEIERLHKAIEEKGGTESYPTEDAYLAVCRALEKTKSELSESQRRENAAIECLNNIYERTRPGGIYGGYPYGGTTGIGSDVYDMVSNWRGLHEGGDQT